MTGDCHFLGPLESYPAGQLEELKSPLPYPAPVHSIPVPNEPCACLSVFYANINKYTSVVSPPAFYTKGRLLYFYFYINAQRTFFF